MFKFRIIQQLKIKKHANFIISNKTASSLDIENLIEYIQKKVYEKKKIYLETEVKFIGTN